MRKFSAVALLAMIYAPAQAAAYTAADEAACRPDVFRLCTLEIPDERRIVACLQRNKQRLSPACYEVFDRETTGKGYAPPPRYIPPPQWR